MSSKVQHRIALELGFDEKIVKRALKKYKFKCSGDFVEYLELHEDEFAAEEREEEEASPEAGKIASKEGIVKTEDPPAATSTPQKTLREETEDLYHRSMCLNCFSRKRSIVTLPCSHFTLCGQCEKWIKKCPRRDCGEKIELSISTFM